MLTFLEYAIESSAALNLVTLSHYIALALVLQTADQSGISVLLVCNSNCEIN